MKKFVTSLPVQLVTFETTLPFSVVRERLEREVNKEGSAQFLPKFASSQSKKEIEDLVNNITGKNDFLYFFEMNHHKWMNAYQKTDANLSAVVYTIGNPLIAETFMRYDIRAGYCIPPRLMIVKDAHTSGTTVFYHLPSSLVITESEELKTAIRVVDDKLEQMITRVTAD